MNLPATSPILVRTPTLRASLEVRVEWGAGNTLRVEHFAEPRSFVVGDSFASKCKVDFELPRSAFASTWFELVAPERDGRHVRVFVPTGAELRVDIRGASYDELALRAAGRWLDSTRKGVAGECVLAHGERATLHAGEFDFVVALVDAEPCDRGAWLSHAAAIPLVAGCVIAAVAFGLHDRPLGRAERYVETDIDLSNPVVAALVAQRASAAQPALVHPAPARQPTWPAVAPIPRVATPPVPPAAVPAPPPTPAPASPPAQRPATATMTTTTSLSAPARTEPRHELADDRPATVQSPSAEDTAHARRVAMMFSMRRAADGLRDCYARFPASGPDAATNASHLSRCIAEVGASSRAVRVATDEVTNAPAGRDAALVEWDIEVDARSGDRQAFAGGRMFVDVDP